MTAELHIPTSTWRPPLPVRMRLVFLVLALLLPALLITGLLLFSLERQASRTQERQLAATARTLAMVIDGRIGEQVAALQALSVSPMLIEGDWRGFAAQSRSALSQSDAWVAVRDSDGRQYVNTFTPTGPLPPLSPDQQIPGGWSGTRSDAKISNVLWGPIAHQPVVVVSRPVALRDGRSVNLSVTMPAASFSKLLARQELPARWTATILDGKGNIVARNRDSERFVGRRATSGIRAAMMLDARGVTGGATLDSVAVVTAFDQLPGYRWAALVAMPRDEALGADKRTIVVAFTFGAALLTAAVLLALHMGRWIAQPVEIVAHAASEWVAGRTANFPTKTGMAEMDALSRAFAAALQAVEERDERQRLLINELNHRVKNTLATVQAVALHTRSGATSIEDYHLSLEGRVIAMSRAHELLTRSAWERAELGELARETLSAFAGSQLRVHGPIAHVGPTEALNLALILYELATNAAKHGALSADGGHVELSWRRVADQTCVRWKESGGPPVAPPTRKGFGSRLITRATRDLQPSELSFPPDGLHCEFTLPTRAS